VDSTTSNSNRLDPVATGVDHTDLAALAILRVTGQPQATIYHTIKNPSNQAR